MVYGLHALNSVKLARTSPPVNGVQFAGKESVETSARTPPAAGASTGTTGPASTVTAELSAEASGVMTMPVSGVTTGATSGVTTGPSATGPSAGGMGARSWLASSLGALGPSGTTVCPSGSVASLLLLLPLHPRTTSGTAKRMRVRER